MKPIFHSIATTILLLSSGPATAVDLDEVREFAEVFVISGQADSRDSVEVQWRIEPDYYLYNNRFLRFESDTPGIVLGEPEIPPGEVKFDELLGEEVEKYRGSLTVRLPLASVASGVHAASLKIRSQGCLEGVLCYPPTEQRLMVSLPLEQSIPSQIEFEPDSADQNVLGGLLGNDRTPALEAEAAFVYEAIGFSEDTVLVRFTAQPGYYLYRDKFDFRIIDPPGISVTDVELPEGTIKDDPEFGEVPVYFGLIEIPVRIARPPGPAGDLTLEADFQGCRDGDICYPPQSRAVTLEMPAATSAVDAAAEPPRQITNPPVSEQDRLATLLTGSPWQAMAAFFLAGLLLAFTPCVFPMVPILSGIIAGQGDKITTGRAFSLSLVYVLAMAATYTVAGVLAGLFGQNLQATFQNPWIIGAFVAVFLLLALSMFGFYELQLPSALQTRLTATSNRQKEGNLAGVAVMGFLSALIVGPCVAPPLMAALIVIGASGSALLGGSALFAMALGMGMPLIAFGVSAGKLLPRAGPWMDTIKAVFGVGLLALAIWMLERILPGAVIMALWGSLAIGCGVYAGAFDRLEAGISGWRRLWKTVGLILVLVGVMEWVGALAGGDNWLRPLESLTLTDSAGTHEEEVEFRGIKSVDDLDGALASAGDRGMGAMLDFYADWCVECIRMERNTFPDAGVRALLERMAPLQADVTANDETDQALMRKFGIIGPPAILFFDRQGIEMKPYRLIGYFSPDEFRAHLELVVDAQ